MSNDQLEDQLYDVVVTVGLVEMGDNGVPYATSKIYRFDVENIQEFLDACADKSIHAERLIASPDQETEWTGKNEDIKE